MLAKSASGLAMIIGCCMAVMTLVSIPIALHFYDEFPPLWLGGLLAVLSIRPILEARLMLPLSLSYDHRVINGADAARFIVKLSGLLSDPFQLLSEV